jgi:hypothetical protein
MYDGKIQFAESFGFIIMYIVYLVVVIGGYFINRRMKDRRALLQAAQTEAAAAAAATVKNYGSIQAAPSTAAAVAVDAETNSSNIPEESYVQPDISYALYLRHAFLPRDDQPWGEKTKLNRAFTIFKVRQIPMFLLV